MRTTIYFTIHVSIKRTHISGLAIATRMRGIGVPPPCKKFLIGFAQISGEALEESGWVQTHPNPPVASPLIMVEL